MGPVLLLHRGRRPGEITASRLDLPLFTIGDFNIAIGYYAEAGDFLGISVSSQNVVMGYEATVGYDGLSVSAPYDDNVVVGSNATSYGMATVAIGSGAQVGEQLTSAIPLVGCIAMGYYAEVDADDGISIGTHSLSGIGIQNTCVGYMAQVQGMATTISAWETLPRIRNDSNYVIVINSAATDGVHLNRLFDCYRDGRFHQRICYHGGWPGRVHQRRVGRSR